YVVLKTKHSAFYATTLELLLRYLGVSSLVLTGLTGDRCVLFSASDAFMRDLRLWVPTDCVASIDPEHNRRALDEMARLFDADLTDSTRLVLSRSAIKRRARAGAARLRSARAPAARPARRAHAPAAWAPRPPRRRSRAPRRSTPRAVRARPVAFRCCLAPAGSRARRRGGARTRRVVRRARDRRAQNRRRARGSAPVPPLPSGSAG